MCLWEVTLKDADLLGNMLGGGIRSNLRQAGHSIYVDAVLSAEERQQRKAMQQLRRELQQQGVRTRWCKATLMSWRWGGADGRRGSWEEVPPLPAEVPGSVAAKKVSIANGGWCCWIITTLIACCAIIPRLPWLQPFHLLCDMVLSMHTHVCLQHMTCSILSESAGLLG
jgi:hypothetical protein